MSYPLNVFMSLITVLIEWKTFQTLNIHYMPIGKLSKLTGRLYLRT